MHHIPRLILFVGLLMLLLSVGIGLAGYIDQNVNQLFIDPVHNFLKDFYSNLSADLFFTAITILVIDRIYGLRTEQVEKRALIHQMGSPNNTIAGEAVRVLRIRGWLEKGSLREADLQEADLSGTDLHKADLQSAILKGAELTDVDLREANLRGADLSLADLSGADLRGADLRDADLTDAILKNADLTGAKVSKEQLDKADEVKGLIPPGGGKNLI
jgi:hypothetical protein